MSNQTNDIGSKAKNKVVYVDGVFDLFHSGHLAFLRKAREFGDVLLVGVVTDADVESYKRKPVIKFQDRLEMLQACRLVDKVIPAELRITKDFIHKNNISVVVHGDDDEQQEFFKIPREMGIMKYVSYTAGISTTQLIKTLKTRNDL
jgi:cytidyltransferase-like protein